MASLENLPKSYSDARNSESRYYFTGKPCKNGHISKRWSHNATCYDCVSANAATFQKDNPERSAENTRAWRSRNPEASRASARRSVAKFRNDKPEQAGAIARRYYDKNRERICEDVRQARVDDPEHVRSQERARYAADPTRKKASVKRWVQNNPDQKAEIDARRRASKRQACPIWLTRDQRNEMAKLYREARRLSRETGVQHHVDHIVPLTSDLVCGLHVPWNLQVLPYEDNIRKSNTLLPEIAGWRA